MSEQSILQLMQGIATDAATTEANQGLGSLGQWPTEGEHEVVLEGLEYGPTTFDWKKPKPGSVPAVEVRALYFFGGPTEKESFAIRGREVVVPKCQLSSLPTGKEGDQQQRARIASERLMGFLTTILGEKVTDWGVGLARAVEKIEAARKSGRSIIVRTRFEYQDSRSIDPVTNKPRRVPNQDIMCALVGE